MPEIRIEVNDETYARVNAAAQGDVSGFATRALELALDEGDADAAIRAKFTPEVLAHLDAICAEADQVGWQSWEDVQARLEERSKSWQPRKHA